MPIQKEQVYIQRKSPEYTEITTKNRISVEEIFLKDSLDTLRFILKYKISKLRPNLTFCLYLKCLFKKHSMPRDEGGMFPFDFIT